VRLRGGPHEQCSRSDGDRGVVGEHDPLATPRRCVDLRTWEFGFGGDVAAGSERHGRAAIFGLWWVLVLSAMHSVGRSKLSGLCCESGRGIHAGQFIQLRTVMSACRRALPGRGHDVCTVRLGSGGCTMTIHGIRLDSGQRFKLKVAVFAGVWLAIGLLGVFASSVGGLSWDYAHTAVGQP